MIKTLAITNQKGGVGKTTTAINLSASFAEIGKKVLLVDFDPQGNATSGVGVELKEGDKTILDAISNKEIIAQIIKKEVKKNLDVLPGDVGLSSLEAELVNTQDKEQELKKTLEGIKNNYDYIVIDCPPAMGILTVNALVASDACIIPVQCEYFSLEGLNQVMNVVELVKSGMNPKLEIEGVVFTMFDQRTKLANDVVNGIKNSLKVHTFETKIPRNIRLAEAPSNGMTIFEYDKNSIGAVRYRLLAIEILEKEVSKDTTKKIEEEKNSVSGVPL